MESMPSDERHHDTEAQPLEVQGVANVSAGHLPGIP